MKPDSVLCDFWAPGLDNRERVGRTLNYCIEELWVFMDREFSARYGAGWFSRMAGDLHRVGKLSHPNQKDQYNLLAIVSRHWEARKFVQAKLPPVAVSLLRAAEQARETQGHTLLAGGVPEARMWSLVGALLELRAYVSVHNRPQIRIATPQNLESKSLRGTLDEYYVDEFYREGGMSLVFRGRRASSPQTEVAIKVLLPDLANQAEYRARLRREAMIGSELQRLDLRSGRLSRAHDGRKHIVPIEDYGEDRGIVFLVEPWIEGGTLEDHLDQPRTVVEVLALYEQVLTPLAYCHARGIIHRDVKPANMLLDERGRLYLGDFGIARGLLDGGVRTPTSTLMGTSEYRAPELWQGHAAAATGRTDVYAAGVVLYRLLTGQLPFQGDELTLRAGHLSGTPQVPHAFNPQIPAALEDLVLQALKKDPADRPSAAELLRGVRAIRTEAERATEVRPLVTAAAARIGEARQRVTSSLVPPWTPGPAITSPAGRASVAASAAPPTESVPPWLLWALGVLLVLALILAAVIAVAPPWHPGETWAPALVPATATAVAALPPTAPPAPPPPTATAAPAPTASSTPAAASAPLAPPTATTPLVTPVPPAATTAPTATSAPPTATARPTPGPPTPIACQPTAGALAQAPIFVSPHDGQPIDYAGSYLFAVRPVSGADGYLWGFKQNGSVVWEDHGSEQYGIPPGTPAHAKFHMGAVEVLVRANICGAWTQVGAITISLNGPAASSSSPAPAATYSSEVFLGDPVSEAGHDLRNWGPVTTALVAGQPTYRTARLQTLDGNNAITFKRVVPGVDYVLTAIVDDGSCDDSFDIVVNGAVLEQYQAQHGYVARRHQVRVPADLVTGDQVTVVFHNRAAADACGLAGVFYVQLESAGQK